jgi:hypothetical protein
VGGDDVAHQQEVQAHPVARFAALLEDDWELLGWNAGAVVLDGDGRLGRGHIELDEHRSAR